MQSGEVPLTVPAETVGATVNVLNEETGLPQPLDTVYVMFVVPAVSPVTKPEPAFTEATAGTVLLQLPPAVPLLVYVVVALIQSGDVPLTVPAVTVALTVNVLNAEAGLPQPVLTVYVMFVVPAVNAITSPVLPFTDATAGTVLVQLPPAVPLLV